jgi:hypothetical protein
MKILFLNHAGGGFADYTDVPAGTTLGQLFEMKLPGANAGDYLVRLNRQPAAADEVLTEGCRVSITPTKIEGARSRLQQRRSHRRPCR